jgi:FlaA1/EpsC-like NDP-sugar epimerase
MSARIRADVSAAILDVVVICAAFTMVLVFRFDGRVPNLWWERNLRFLPCAAVIVLVINAAFGLYGQIWRFASVLEAQRLLTAGATSGLVLGFLDLVHAYRMPLSVIALGTFMAVGFQGALRFRARLFALNRAGRDPSGLRVLVLGAGSAGSSLVRDMLRDTHRGLIPVAFLDDNPLLHGRTLHGIRVEGSLYQLPEIAREHDAHQAYLAVSDASQDLVQVLSELADDAGIALRIIPRPGELGHAGVTVSDVRDLRIEDLLGRQQVSVDLAAVSALLAGRRVLVTGAGGSIGSEIARQAAACGPAELLLLDHDETHLHDCMATLPGDATALLVDIRDRDLVRRTMIRHRPQVVFHAAAHKHVPLLEDHPCEAVKSNIVGTDNVVSACVAVGVERFVFISTDKAVSPSSVMGATKYVGEQLIVGASSVGHRYSAVRFGNVLGSRGSVIPTFVRQIRDGGPITVTDARMTRYFMSIPEAVQLVLQAAALAEGGDIFMLDMGEPVRIIDLATRMVRLSGRRVGEDIEIRVTGVRPGEKLVEELHAVHEETEATEHPSVVRLRPIALDPATLTTIVGTLRALADHGLNDLVREGLFALTRGEPWRYIGTVELPERRSDSSDRTLAIDLAISGT